MSSTLPAALLSPRRFAAALRGAPLSGIVLVVLLMLPSSISIPQEVVTDTDRFWHPAYGSVLDAIMVVALLIDFALRRVKIRLIDVGALFLAIAVFIASWAMSERSFGDNAFFEICLEMATHCVRFFFAFVVLRSIANTSDENELFAYWHLIALGLCASSLFVAAQQYEALPRLWAAGMTVAGFSQFLAVTLFLTAMRRRWVLASVYAAFLVLTVGRTAILTLAAISYIYMLISRSGKQRERLLLTSVLIVAGLYALGDFLYSHFDLFATAIDSALNPDSIETLNARTYLWAYALEVWERGLIPWHGIGLFGTPQLLWNVAITPDETYFAPHFHSIFIELFFGGGWLALLVFPLLIYRVVLAFGLRAYQGALIYIFFLTVQMVDFTLYQPKPELLWAMMIAFAESEIYYRQRLRYARRSASGIRTASARPHNR